jgi:hypothetical protein
LCRRFIARLLDSSAISECWPRRLVLLIHTDEIICYAHSRPVQCELESGIPQSEVLIRDEMGQDELTLERFELVSYFLAPVIQSRPYEE